MRYFRLLLVLFTCSAFLPVRLHAQTQPASTPAAPTQAPVANAANPTTPAEFFARARQLSDLEAAGVPFHLKATYVATGDAEFTGNGTYEEWWQSKEAWRKEATLGDYRYVGIRKTGVTRFYSTSDYVPLRLRQAMGAVLVRIAPDISSSREWQIQHTKLSGASLTVLFSKYGCGDTTPKVQCVNLDYLTPSGVLRIRRDAAITTLYNGIQPFQSLLIPRTITVAGGSTSMLTISITALEPLGTEEKMLSNEASVPKTLQPAMPHIRADPRAVQSKAISQPFPEYPTTARLNRQQGTVVMLASIDENGKVREPYVIVSAGPLLDGAALRAIRTWRYRPASLDGIPVLEDTSITIVFSFRE